LKLIITILVILILFFFFIRFIEQRSLYFPFKAIEATPKDLGLEYEDVAVTTEDGIQLAGWFIPADGPRATILLSHGNGGNISHRLEKIKILHDLSLDVLIYDYRGYGRSSGRPSEDGLYRDAQAMYDYLIDKKRIRRQEIIAYGESLGAAVTIDLALNKEVGAIIVESGFTSINDMARKIFGVAPSFLLHARYDSVNKIGSIKQPKLIMHSRDDEIVPFEQGKQLFETAPEPKTFLELQGGHNDGFLVSGDVYKRGIDTFTSPISPSAVP